MIYAVMEQVGNFSHTLKEFTHLDDARDFMLERAETDAVALDEDANDDEYDANLELSLSYYNIEVQDDNN